MKPKWDRKSCGCVKANLAISGKVTVRRTKHRGKPSKRSLAYFDSDGIVRKDAT